MPITPESISYPVLCIPGSLGVYVARNRRELERCRAVLFWKARLYDGLQIADLDGKKYAVTRATIFRPRSGIAQWLARVLDLSVQVSLELEDRGIATLAEIGNAVETAIQEDPEAFEEISGRSIEWWRAVLAASTSVADVIRALGEAPKV